MSSIKIIRASQATHIYLYKKLNSKILKCCASIYFNKQCLKHNITPNYTKINVVLDNCFIYNIIAIINTTRCPRSKKNVQLHLSSHQTFHFFFFASYQGHQFYGQPLDEIWKNCSTITHTQRHTLQTT